MAIYTMSTLPEDLRSYLRSISDNERRVISLLDTLTEDQATWKPDKGRRWSVAQCIDHTVATNSQYLAALRLSVEYARLGHRPLKAGGWFSEFFLRKTEPPVSLKVKAPAKITPRPTILPAEALKNFSESNEDIRDFVRATSHLDLCSVRFTNPFIPILRFTVATGLLIIAAHTRRHLWQAERLLECSGFPDE
jgi:hypothetical protein